MVNVVEIMPYVSFQYVAHYHVIILGAVNNPAVLANLALEAVEPLQRLSRPFANPVCKRVVNESAFEDGLYDITQRVMNYPIPKMRS